MKENYQLQLDQLIGSLPEGQLPTLLLHSCCGPCSTYVLSYLAKYFSISVYFYNPNIMPLEEYELRLQTQKEVINRLCLPHSVQLVTPEYNVNEFLNIAKGFETEPERGERCKRCMALRIQKSAEYAAAHHFDYFCTTLSVSPHKDAVLLHALSEKFASEYHIPALPADFKKKGGFLESTKISKQLNLYRQNYCGCIFSKTSVQDKKR